MSMVITKNQTLLDTGFYCILINNQKPKTLSDEITHNEFTGTPRNMVIFLKLIIDCIIIQNSVLTLLKKLSKISKMNLKT